MVQTSETNDISRSLSSAFLMNFYENERERDQRISQSSSFSNNQSDYAFGQSNNENGSKKRTYNFLDSTHIDSKRKKTNAE